MLVDISKVMSGRDLDISTMNVRVSKQQMATIDMGFEISSTEELQKTIEKLRAIEGVKEIIRSNG